MKAFKFLHPSTKAFITAQDYNLFCQHILCFPSVLRLVDRRKPNIAEMFQVALEAPVPPLAAPGQPEESAQLGTEAWAELDGLCWEFSEFEGESATLCFLD